MTKRKASVLALSALSTHEWVESTCPGTRLDIHNGPNDQDALKWYGLIPSFFSFDSRVCLGIPSIAAAPFAPETRPDACRSACSITVFSRAERSEASVRARTGDDYLGGVYSYHLLRKVGGHWQEPKLISLHVWAKRACLEGNRLALSSNEFQDLCLPRRDASIDA